jgi:hypothetical protein
MKQDFSRKEGAIQEEVCLGWLKFFESEEFKKINEKGYLTCYEHGIPTCKITVSINYQPLWRLCVKTSKELGLGGVDFMGTSIYYFDGPSASLIPRRSTSLRIFIYFGSPRIATINKPRFLIRDGDAFLVGTQNVGIPMMDEKTYAKGYLVVGYFKKK